MSNNVLIGGSSSSNLDKIYYDEAFLIANYLAQKGYNLVCGCVCGLMNSVSLAFKNNGKDVQIMETKNDLADYYPYPMQLFPSVCDRKKALYNNVSLAVFYQVVLEHLMNYLGRLKLIDVRIFLIQLLL